MLWNIHELGFEEVRVISDQTETKGYIMLLLS